MVIKKRTKYQSFDDFGHKGSSRSKDKLNKLNLPDLTGKTVLDIGCNAGYFCIKLSKRGAKECDGLDSVSSNIDLAKEWAKTYNCQNTNFYTVDFFDFKETKKYDIVICLSTFHYFRSRQTEFLKRAYELLTPNGMLILEVGLSKKNQQSDNFVELFQRGVDKTPCSFPNEKTILKFAANQNFTLNFSGPSVMQGGDPIPRFVLHLLKTNQKVISQL